MASSKVLLLLGLALLAVVLLSSETASARELEETLAAGQYDGHHHHHHHHHGGHGGHGGHHGHEYGDGYRHGHGGYGHGGHGHGGYHHGGGHHGHGAVEETVHN